MIVIKANSNYNVNSSSNSLAVKVLLTRHLGVFLDFHWEGFDIT